MALEMSKRKMNPKGLNAYVTLHIHSVGGGRISGAISASVMTRQRQRKRIHLRTMMMVAASRAQLVDFHI